MLLVCKLFEGRGRSKSLPSGRKRVLHEVNASLVGEATLQARLLVEGHPLVSLKET